MQLRSTALATLMVGSVLGAQSTNPVAPPPDLLEAYSLGQRVSLSGVSPLRLQDMLRSTGKKWIADGPEEDRERRRNVVALAALDGALAATGRGVQEAPALLEWACDFLRRDSPTRFEHDWMMASIVIAERRRDEQFLLGPRPGRAGCSGSKPACFQVRHAMSRFPDDAGFRASRVFARTELNALTRRPIGVDPLLVPGTIGTMVLNPEEFAPLGSTALKDAQHRINETFSLLGELVSDPQVRERARLRRAVLRYELGQLDASRGDLIDLIFTSRDPYFLYFSHFILALGFDSEGRESDASREFAAAVAVDPGVASGAVALATHYFLQDARDAAASVLDRAFAQPSSQDDLWEWPCADCRGFSALMKSLHAMVRR